MIALCFARAGAVDPAADRDQLHDAQAKIRQLEARLAQWHRGSRTSKLLPSVPGVGFMGASASMVCDSGLFRSRREFATWLGMTPRQNSSGGKERLGRTSNRGDKHIHHLLVAGAVAILPDARSRDQERRMGSRHAGAQAGEGGRGRARTGRTYDRIRPGRQSQTQNACRRVPCIRDLCNGLEGRFGSRAAKELDGGWRQLSSSGRKKAVRPESASSGRRAV
jgi:hypothetical protein